VSILKNWYEKFIKEDSKYNNHISKFINYIEIIGKGDTPIVISKAKREIYQKFRFKDFH